MKPSALVNRSGVVTTGALTGLLFILLNGEQNFSRLGVPERWFGWPLIYYGDSGPGSVELTVFVVPMMLNILIHAFISGCIALSVSFVIHRFGLSGFPYHRFLRMISIASIGLFALIFFGLGGKVSMCCGPRDNLEFPKHFILGPRFVTNPMG